MFHVHWRFDLLPHHGHHDPVLLHDHEKMNNLNHNSLSINHMDDLCFFFHLHPSFYPFCFYALSMIRCLCPCPEYVPLQHKCCCHYRTGPVLPELQSIESPQLPKNKIPLEIHKSTYLFDELLDARCICVTHYN